MRTSTRFFVVSGFSRTCVLTGCLTLGLAGAAHADVCVTVDEAHDTLAPQDRSAALIFLARQFETSGERVVAAPCADPYAVSHVKWGDTIAITLSGSKGHREGTALGFDDVPAVYNQMVRSLLTGEPMTLSGVVDRTNVSQTQTEKLRVGSDSIFYARLGYSGIFAGDSKGVPSLGLLGYRHELDAFAIDVSFFNFGMNGDSNSYYGSSSPSANMSWLKLEALHFSRPEANASAYFGGGLSYGMTSIGHGNAYTSTSSGTSWEGSGLQAELTAGYELARASTLRMFIQADAGLPLYELTSTTYTPYTYTPGHPYVPAAPSTSHRYAPSATISIGFGWQRGARTKR